MCFSMFAGECMAWHGYPQGSCCVYETQGLVVACLSLNSVRESKHVPAMGSTGHGKVSFLR